MMALLQQTSLVFLFIALGLALVRFARAPHFLDRVILFDVVSVVMVGGIVIFAIEQKQAHNLDIALVTGLLAFIGGIGLAYYWEQHDE